MGLMARQENVAARSVAEHSLLLTVNTWNTYVLDIDHYPLQLEASQTSVEGSAGLSMQTQIFGRQFKPFSGETVSYFVALQREYEHTNHSIWLFTLPMPGIHSIMWSMPQN